MAKIITKLWDHQIKAVEYAKERPACFWEMEMRTGKTLSALALIVQERYRYVLIVCPKKILQVWEDEISSHTEGLSYFSFDTPGTSSEKLKQLKHWMQNNTSGASIVLINYELIHRKNIYEFLSDRYWDLMVLDEGHKIKSHNGVISKAAWRIGKRADKRIILTGTMFPNSPSDAFGQVRFLDDKLFDQPSNPITTVWWRFRDMFEITRPLPDTKAIMTVGHKNLNILVDKLAPITYSVKSADVIDMPDEIDIIRHVRMNDKMQKIYNEFEKEFIADLERGVITASNVLVRSLRLRQMAGGYVAPDDGIVEEVHNEKIEMLSELIDELGTSKFIVFAQFHQEIEEIHKLLLNKGLTTIRIDGSMNEYKQWPTAQAAVIQLQSGSEGISLKQADHCIFYSLPYSYGQYQQARARIKKESRGEGHILSYYHLICRNTIDVAMYKLLQQKGAKIADLIRLIKER